MIAGIGSLGAAVPILGGNRASRYLAVTPQGGSAGAVRVRPGAGGGSVGQQSRAEQHDQARPALR